LWTGFRNAAGEPAGVVQIAAGCEEGGTCQTHTDDAPRAPPGTAPPGERSPAELREDRTDPIGAIEPLRKLSDLTRIIPYSDRKLRDMAQHGELPVVRIGRRYFYRESEIRSWLLAASVPSDHAVQSSTEIDRENMGHSI